MSMFTYFRYFFLPVLFYISEANLVDFLSTSMLKVTKLTCHLSPVSPHPCPLTLKKERCASPQKRLLHPQSYINWWAGNLFNTRFHHDTPPSPSSEIISQMESLEQRWWMNGDTWILVVKAAAAYVHTYLLLTFNRRSWSLLCCIWINSEYCLPVGGCLHSARNNLLPLLGLFLPVSLFLLLSLSFRYSSRLQLRF